MRPILKRADSAGNPEGANYIVDKIGMFPIQIQRTVVRWIHDSRRSIRSRLDSQSLRMQMALHARGDTNSEVASQTFKKISGLSKSNRKLMLLETDKDFSAARETFAQISVSRVFSRRRFAICWATQDMS